MKKIQGCFNEWDMSVRKSWATDTCLPKARISDQPGEGFPFLFREMKRGLILLAILAAMLLGANNAHAAVSCTGTPSADIFTFPSPIAVPRDNVAGGTVTPLTPWVVGPADANWWTCDTSGNPYVGTVFSSLLASANLTFSDQGVNYAVFNTGLSGVGIVIGARVYSNGCGWSGWFPLVNPFGYTCNANGTWGNGGQVMLRLVKTGAIAGGTVNTLQVAKAYTAGASGTGTKFFTVNPVTFQPLSCTTPSISVQLPPVNKNEFATAADLKTTPFHFSLNSCPSGMTRIRYRIDPVNPVIDATNGVFAIDSGSGTAEGVSLRLTDENDQPIRFQDGSYVVSGYDANQGSSHLEIPLKVSYHRTSSNAADYVNIRPGEVRSAAQLTLYYE